MTVWNGCLKSTGYGAERSERMSREEVIKKWQRLLANYKELELICGDSAVLNSLKPDIEVLTETIELLKKDEEQEND